MKRILEGQAVADFVANVVGVETFSDPFIAIGVAVHDDVIGGVVFNNYANGNIDVSVAAGRGAVTPRFLAFLADYVWRDLNCHRASFVTQDDRSADLVRRMGGQPEGTAINWFGEGQDGQRFVVLRADWKLTRC